jgi:hypothetical protein
MVCIHPLVAADRQQKFFFIPRTCGPLFIQTVHAFEVVRRDVVPVFLFPIFLPRLPIVGKPFNLINAVCNNRYQTLSQMNKKITNKGKIDKCFMAPKYFFSQTCTIFPGLGQKWASFSGQAPQTKP